ncbi:MAG TPA: metallophosphoesterase, partial [Candidatus Sulfotelmatobacter sp.]|nr:metallophosphoesterase [Candidatus Sulfotelmatobacter sp.]
SWTNCVFNTRYLNTLDFLRNLPLLPCLGNHDVSLPDQSTPANPGALARKYWPLSLYAAADRSYYSFDYGPAHFTVLDQYADNSSYTLESSAQYQWLASDLANSTKSWKIVMFHEPAWTASTLEGSDGNNTAIQTKLCPLFKNNGVKLVIQGHASYYARVTPPDGLTYLTLGGGGAPLATPDPNAPYFAAAAKKHHFARFTIAGNALTVNVIDNAGATIESFVIN